MAVIVGAFVLVAPVLGYIWYSHSETTPFYPVDNENGGLYIAIDRPNVSAELRVFVEDQRSPHPVVRIGVTLSDPNARFALVAQGFWAFTDYPELDAPASWTHASGPAPGTFINRHDEPGFLPIGDTPSIVIVGRNCVAPSGMAQILDCNFPFSGYLPRPVEVEGHGLARGMTAWITGTQVLSPVGLSGFSGSWVQPSSTSITLAVEQTWTTLDTSRPPATMDDTGLNWTATGSLMQPSWQVQDPASADHSDTVIFALGILLGIWGAVIVEVARRVLEAFVGPESHPDQRVVPQRVTPAPESSNSTHQTQPSRTVSNDPWYRRGGR